MGIAAGLLCLFSIKHFAISPIVKSNDITNFHFDPSTYNKSCGLSFWKTGKNFNNKDDLHFFPTMTNGFVSEKRHITLIEFGANIGQFSEAMFAVQRNSSYTIHSIEPVPGLFQVLKNRSEKFNKNSHDKHYQYNLAISNRIGTLPIFSPAVHTEAASLAKSSKFNFCQNRRCDGHDSGRVRERTSHNNASGFSQNRRWRFWARSYIRHGPEE